MPSDDREELEAALYRTDCDGCGVPLHGTDGFEAGHGSYCDHCAQDYRYVDAGLQD